MGEQTLGDKTIFRRAVSQPIKEGMDEGLVRLRGMMSLIALRRSKSTAGIKLVDKHVELRSVEFASGNPHHEVYDTIFRSAKIAVQAVMRGSPKQGNSDSLSHGSVFEVLTRMRQACCSGKLVPPERLKRAEEVLAAVDSKGKLTAEEGQQLLEKLKGALEDEEQESNPECSICFESMDENTAVVLKACGHVFCQECIQKVSDLSAGGGKCPYCRNGFKELDMVKWSSAVAAAKSDAPPAAVSLSQQMDGVCPSPKLEALLIAIREMKSGEKAVIYSQFTMFLDEIERFLDSHNLSYTRIDGKRTAIQRIDAVTEFGKDDGGPMLMLCSLHAAGTGLNLTRGNHVFMMDTVSCFPYMKQLCCLWCYFILHFFIMYPSQWFNSSVEQQAMDRGKSTFRFDKIHLPLPAPLRYIR